MTYLAILLVLAAAALRTRFVRLHLALRLLRLSNALHDAGARVLRQVEQEMGQ
ncbi:MULTISPECIES: hypothetical protein [unclassified Mesorhizobium]|uniref:hypothetical protein n=1 Tax=unclassified Mesorhizobium TaxID=325217 RepID=UPI00163D7BF0|nr:MULTISPECIES: hypothetical protein [unclassified Mesorhizobium]